MPEFAAPSPCVNVCQLNERGLCLGCFRSISEIAAWREMATEEKLSVLANTTARQNELFDGATA